MLRRSLTPILGALAAVCAAALLPSLALAQMPSTYTDAAGIAHVVNPVYCVGSSCTSGGTPSPVTNQNTGGGTITTAGTSQVALAADSSRGAGGWCQANVLNTGVLYFNYGQTATTTVSTPNQFSTNPGGSVPLSTNTDRPYQGALNVTGTVAGDAYSCVVNH